MTDLNTPVAHSGETLVHLHFINPDTNDRSTYIGEAASQRLRQDPATSRRTLDVSIDLGPAIDLAWYAEHYGDAEWMVHIEGPDDCITHKDEAATVPLTEKDARDLALAVNMTAVREREASEFAPFMHATVFHNGVPVADDAEDDPVDITEIRRRLVGKSNEYYDLRKPFHKAMRNEVRIEDIKAGACLAWEGLAFASLSLNTLAFILRVAEQDDPTMAQKLAQIIEAVMDDGGEVLEDANADLDEQVAAPVEPETTPAVTS